MTVIMQRKAAEFWWSLPIKGVARKPFTAPPDVALYEKSHGETAWREITWEDVHRKRTERIRQNIESKRRSFQAVVKPCIVWVFHVDSWIMGGYYTIIKTLHEEYYLNFRAHRLHRDVGKDELQRQLMEAFPLCLPMPELFDEWMKLFARKYSNSHFYKRRKIQGTAIAWCKLDPYGYLMGVSADRYKLNQ